MGCSSDSNLLLSLVVPGRGYAAFSGWGFLRLSLSGKAGPWSKRYTRRCYCVVSRDCVPFVCSRMEHKYLRRRSCITIRDRSLRETSCARASVLFRHVRIDVAPTISSRATQSVAFRSSRDYSTSIAGNSHSDVYHGNGCLWATSLSVSGMATV